MSAGSLSLDSSDKGWEIDVRVKRAYVIATVKLHRPINPKEVNDILAEMEPRIPHRRLLIVSGRMPIWLAAAISHHFAHLNRYVAFYDPKLEGAVVVSSHGSAWHTGDVVFPEEDEI